jgi:hypothetical protein
VVLRPRGSSGTDLFPRPEEGPEPQRRARRRRRRPPEAVPARLPGEGHRRRCRPCGRRQSHRWWSTVAAGRGSSTGSELQTRARSRPFIRDKNPSGSSLEFCARGARAHYETKSGLVVAAQVRPRASPVILGGPKDAATPNAAAQGDACAHTWARGDRRARNLRRERWCPVGGTHSALR